MKVLLCRWAYPTKGANKRYTIIHRPVIIASDDPNEQGEMVAEFSKVEDALEYIQFKGFDLIYSEWKDSENA
jgi:hypothetical protein